MDWFGHLMLCAGAVLSALGVASVLGRNDSHPSVVVGSRLFYAAAAASLVALLSLIFSLLTHDYRLSYVQDYADHTMSTIYLLTAAWGGQEGSLLFWAVLQTCFTAAVAMAKFERSRELVPTALAILGAVQLFFQMLVLFFSNPFLVLGSTVFDGVGLLPLLRNPYMAIHPPTLFLGFVGFAVLFAFAFSALIHKEFSRAWISDLRGFLLFAWVFLTIGNILGMVWAYEELGWGGYWGWDPVENASFIPWLTGTALVHASLVAAKENRFIGWTLFFSFITFVLAVFGTYLTRSGIIDSMHAFSGATVSPYLLGFMVIAVVAFIGLVVLRRKHLFSTNPSETPFFSREGMFQLSVIVFLMSAAFVWFATMAPLFSQWIRGEKVAVTPDFFNKWMIPFGLLILAFIGFCLFFSRMAKDSSSILKQAAWPFAAGLAMVGVVLVLKGNAALTWQPIAVGFFLGASGWHVFREISIQVGKATGDGFSRKRLGGQLIHLGVISCFVGFTGNAFTKEVVADLNPGESVRIGQYDLRFTGHRETNDFERHALLADVEVRADGKLLGTFSPARHSYHSHPGKPTSEVVIRTGLVEDLYLMMGEVDSVDDKGFIRAVINPLVLWVWVGGVLMILGTIVAAYPPRKNKFFSRNGLKAMLLWGASLGAAWAIVWGLDDFAICAAILTFLGLASMVYFMARVVFGLFASKESA